MKPIYLFKPTESDRADFPGIPYGARVKVATPSGETGALPAVWIRTLQGQLIGMVSTQSLEVLR